MEYTNYFYIVTNLINGNRYYGSGSRENYQGSGVALNQAYKKYSREDFTMTILKRFKTRQEAFDFEDRFLKLYDIKSLKNTYNQSNNACGGDTWSGRSHSKESINAITETNKQTWNKTNKVNEHSELMQQIYSERGEEISKKKKAYWTNEKRNERSSKVKDMWKDPELKKQMGAKISELKKKKVICDGIEFISIGDATNHFGLSYYKVTSKMSDKNETNWYRL